MTVSVPRAARPAGNGGANPGNGEANAGMLSEIRRALPVLTLLVRREFQSRYAGSTLGVVWNAVHPLVLILIYITVFSNIMVDRAGGGSRLAYAIHLTSGIIPWFFFQEVVQRNTAALVDNANFLKKLAMPVEVLHVSVLVNAFVVHGASLLALAGVLWLFGAEVPVQVIFALPVMLLLGLFALGVSFILSVLHLVVRDIGQFVTIGLQFLFWLTPIVYHVGILPEGIVPWLHLNPILGFVALIQSLFGSPYHNFDPQAYHLIFLLPLAFLLMGVAFLRRQRTEILDAL